MSDLMGTRPIRAPVKEWLNKQELQSALEIGERALDRMIKAGDFPRGTPWDGKELRWRWWVVVWYELDKDVSPLLRSGNLDDEEPDEADSGKATEKRK